MITVTVLIPLSPSQQVITQLLLSCEHFNRIIFSIVFYFAFDDEFHLIREFFVVILFITSFELSSSVTILLLLL